MFALLNNKREVVAVSETSPEFKEGFWYANNIRYASLSTEASASILTDIPFDLNIGDTVSEEGVITKFTQTDEQIVELLAYQEAYTLANTPVNPTQYLIDKGSFFDRFGSVKMAVLLSQDLTIKAILADVGSRQWIDLSREEVAQSLAYMGTVIPDVTKELQTSILTTPVTAEENLVLRKLYFS